MSGNPSSAPAPGQALLDIDEACVLRGERLILDHLSLRIDAGQHTAILGPNGSGKSTLVKLISRQIYPLARDDGKPSVKIFGRDRWRVDTLRGLLGIVSPAVQLDYTSDTPIEVFEAVVSGFFAARGLGLDHRVTDDMRDRAFEALAQMDATALIGRDMASLSTGEARRVLIARALVHRPRALLLDEPCAGLDMGSRRQFLEGLRSLARAGTTLLLVTHHIEEILPEIQHVVMLAHGKVLHQGDKSSMLQADKLGEVFANEVSVERRGDWYWAALL